MITFENVTKHYPGKSFALNSISFTIKKGEKVALIGKNGAGKSTLFKSLMGLSSIDKGSILFEEKNKKIEPTSFRKQIGYLPENSPLLLEFTVIQYLKMVAECYGFQKITHRIQEILVLCQLEDVKYRKILKLSKGYRQRVALAATVIHDPAVLVLDEPTVGLDPKQIVQFRNLIEQTSAGKVLIFATHILSEAQKICDRYLYLEDGKLKQDQYMSVSKHKVLVRAMGEIPTDIKINIVSEKVLPGEWREYVIDSNNPESVNKKLVEKGVKVKHIEHLLEDIESLF